MFVCGGVCTTQTGIQVCQLNTEDLGARLPDCHVWLVVPLHKGTQLRVSGDWKPACALGALYQIPAEGPCALVMALCNTPARWHKSLYLYLVDMRNMYSR